MKKFEKRSKPHRSGFTLIELVMVIMILAIVAGIATPLVGWLRRSANYASQANIQAALASNLEFYRTTYGNNGYPSHMDSLMYAEAGGTPTTIIGTDGDSSTDDVIATDGIEKAAVVLPLTGDFLDCLKSLTCVYDHSDGDGTSSGTGSWVQGLPGNSGTVDRELTCDSSKNSTGEIFAVLNQTTFDETKGYTDGTDGIAEVNNLMSEYYGTDPAEWPAATEVKHVLLGIGPYSDLVGTVLHSAPSDSRVNPKAKYNRFVACYAVYSPRNGRRAQLKGVLNAKGRSANNALSEFWMSTNAE